MVTPGELPTPEGTLPVPTPFGAWPSPQSALDVARGGVRLGDVATSVGADGVSLWWGTSDPGDAGRSSITEQRPDGTRVAWLPAGFDARTRVHEYGGGAWVPVPGGLVFSHFVDSRLYRLDAPGAEPVPLTPAPDQENALRYGELVVLGDAVLCVRESHAVDGTVSRALVRVPLQPGEVTVAWEGSHFLASLRVSPDGTTLAWLTWDHPRMPWDGTELRLGSLADGLADARVVAGGPTESLFSPVWGHDGTLFVVSDASGWWNVHRVDDAGLVPLWTVEQECGFPLWQLGYRSMVALGPDAGEHAGRLAVLHGTGTYALDVLDPATGELHPLGLPYTAYAPALATAGGTLLCLAGGAATSMSVVAVDLASARAQVLQASVESLPGPQWLPVPEPVSVASTDGRQTYATLYRPTSPLASGPDGALPPYVMLVHGGPTAQSQAAYHAEVTYFTSRGIGVVDVDYGGSSGYGRAYRELLQGQWGVVDVEDCVAVATWLGTAGLADPDRVVIRGGSAGGWTVLSCLTRTQAFAAGASYFGVAELERFAADTHDFESRYLDGLIGPLPESAALYRERAPLTHAGALAVPVLLLQGLDDKVVPPSQSEMFRDAALRNGVPHAYLPFAGEGHGFRRAETIVAALEAELSFYGQVLGFTPPDVPLLELVRPA